MLLLTRTAGCCAVPTKFAESFARGFGGGRGIWSGPSQASRPAASWQGAGRGSFTGGLPVCAIVQVSAGQPVIVLT